MGALILLTIVIISSIVTYLSTEAIYRIVKVPIKNIDDIMHIPQKRYCGIMWKSFLKNNEILNFDEAVEYIKKDKNVQKTVVYKEYKGN